MQKIIKLAEHAGYAARAWLGRDILKTWGKPRAPGCQKLCLFSHWDKQGIIDEYVLYYLARIADQGFSIDLVSTSSHLEPESLEKALRICDRVVLRRNIGLDFASWVDLVRQPSTFQDCESLLLANDSVFGPFHDLGPIFDRIRADESSVWGLTENYDITRHLQSYFLVIPREILRSRSFRSFWRTVVPLASKSRIVKRYEVGFSRKILKGGGSIRAAFPAQEVLQKASLLGEEFQYHEELAKLPYMNITLYAWDLLLREYQFPFIKTDAFKQDRYQSRSLSHWPDLIPQESKHLVDVIFRYLRRAHPDAKALE
jgi:hypothetical protein